MSLVSDAVWDALSAALEPPEGEPPELVRRLVGRVGGIGPLARITSGLPADEKLPPSGSYAFRRYRADRRSIERYLRGERSPSAGRLERLAFAVFSTVDSAWRGGILIQISGGIAVNGYVRVPGSPDRKDDPNAGGSRTVTIIIPAPEAAEIVDAFEDGDRGLFDELLGDDELADWYGVEELELGEEVSISVRPLGRNE